MNRSAGVLAGFGYLHAPSRRGRRRSARFRGINREPWQLVEALPGRGGEGAPTHAGRFTTPTGLGLEFFSLETRHKILIPTASGFATVRP